MDVEAAPRQDVDGRAVHAAVEERHDAAFVDGDFSPALAMRLGPVKLMQFSRRTAAASAGGQRWIWPVYSHR